MKPQEQIKLNAKNLLRFFNESHQQWVFPLVSVGAFLWLAMVVSFFDFLGLSFLFKNLIKTNQAVFDACSERIDQFHNKQITFQDNLTQFENDLAWEQEVVERYFKLPFYLKPFLWFGLVLNPITQRFYLALPLWKRSEREKMALNMYRDLKKIGLKKAYEKSMKFF